MQLTVLPAPFAYKIIPIALLFYFFTGYLATQICIAASLK
jgi:hypothetical protein